MAFARQLPKSITEEKYRRLAAQIPPGTRLGRRDRLILEVMWDAGLRVAEVAALAPGDLIEASDSYWISVRDGKGRKARNVAIGDNLAGMYSAWAEALPLGSRGLFPSMSGTKLGEPISDRGIRRMVSKLSSSADVTVPAPDGSSRAIGPHVLRHSYATRMLSYGMPLQMLKEQLGHSSITTTAIYLHVENAELSRVIKTITDGHRHIDSAVASHREGSLDRQVAVLLDDIPARNPVDRLEKAEIAEIVAQVGIHAAVIQLRKTLDGVSAEVSRDSWLPRLVSE